MNIYHFENDAALQLFLKNRTHEIKKSSKECTFNGRKYLKVGSLVERKNRFWKFQRVLLVIVLAIPALCFIPLRKRLFSSIKQYRRGFETTASLYVLSQLNISTPLEKKKSSPVEFTPKPSSPLHVEEIKPLKATEQTEKAVNLLPDISKSSDMSTYFAECRSVTSTYKAEYEQAKSNWESSAPTDEKFLELSKVYKLKYENYLQSLEATELAYVNFLEGSNSDSEKSREQIEKLLEQLNLETDNPRIRDIKRKIIVQVAPEQSHQIFQSKNFKHNGITVIEFLKDIALDETRFKKFIVTAKESDILHYLSEFKFSSPDLIFIHRLVNELLEQNKLISVLEKLEASQLSLTLLNELPLEKLKHCMSLYASKPEMISTCFSLLTEQVEFDHENRLMECYKELAVQAPQQILLAYKTIVHCLNNKVVFRKTTREQLEQMYNFVFDLNGLYEEHNPVLNAFLQKNVESFFNFNFRADKTIDHIFLHVLAIRSTEKLADNQIKYIIRFPARAFLFLFMEHPDQIKFLDYLYKQMKAECVDVMKKSYKDSITKIFSMLTAEEIEKLHLNDDLKALQEQSKI